ncbi:MarR family winged helix-turn-helix transcriptional regulator [Amycolatopsis sp. VS8301801F10]|uniref:MarR family winged helix-turn-helix transcriptional regulator n=1 Tax=unclassified Amycolatopsis TaxID=2618356 RepID=UPI0038FC1F36
MTGESDLLATATAVRNAVSLVKRRTHDSSSSGLSLPEASVLSRLDRNGMDTIAGLARWEQITPQAMGTTVAALEARGLVRRSPDPADKRRQLLSLTDAGTHLVRSVRDEVTERYAKLMDEHFTAEEVAALREGAALLERLAQLL